MITKAINHFDCFIEVNIACHKYRFIIHFLLLNVRWVSMIFDNTSDQSFLLFHWGWNCMSSAKFYNSFLTFEWTGGNHWTAWVQSVWDERPSAPLEQSLGSRRNQSDLSDTICGLHTEYTCKSFNHKWAMHVSISKQYSRYLIQFNSIQWINHNHY